MVICKWANIATKAYQQAVKYETVSECQRKELFNFIHDWFRQIQDEKEALDNNEETPMQSFRQSMDQLNYILIKEKNK